MGYFTALWLSINMSWVICVVIVSLLKSREKGDSCSGRGQFGSAVMAILVPTVLWWFVYFSIIPPDVQ